MTGRLRISPFSLRDTLESGQFFRFTRFDDSYLVQTHGRMFSLRQHEQTLFFAGVEEDFVRRFFRLDESLDAILKEIDQDPMIHQAIRRYRGLRLIRQDPWECLISYLCSSAKAIPHIRFLVEGLCRLSGKKIHFGHYIGYKFPEPSCLKTSHGLEEVGAGFRAAYLAKAGGCIDRDQLLSLKDLPYRQARERLTGLAGVGKKVADCTLLYSLDFLEAFPIDTWIKKGLKEVYFRGKRVGEKELETFVSGHFGPLAGYAQLYLYQYWRHHLIRP